MRARPPHWRKGFGPCGRRGRRQPPQKGPATSAHPPTPPPPPPPGRVNRQTCPLPGTALPQPAQPPPTAAASTVTAAPLPWRGTSWGLATAVAAPRWPSRRPDAAARPTRPEHFPAPAPPTVAMPQEASTHPPRGGGDHDDTAAAAAAVASNSSSTYPGGLGGDEETAAVDSAGRMAAACAHSQGGAATSARRVPREPPRPLAVPACPCLAARPQHGEEAAS